MNRSRYGFIAPICAIIALSFIGCASAPTTPSSTSSDEEAAPVRAEETQTEDSTRATSKEEIDLGLDGSGTGNVVIEAGETPASETAEGDAPETGADGDAAAGTGDESDDSAKSDDAVSTEDDEDADDEDENEEEEGAKEKSDSDDGAASDDAQAEDGSSTLDL